jgi:hypothetical protein
MRERGALAARWGVERLFGAVGGLLLVVVLLGSLLPASALALDLDQPPSGEESLSAEQLALERLHEMQVLAAPYTTTSASSGASVPAAAPTCDKWASPTGLDTNNGGGPADAQAFKTAKKLVRSLGAGQVGCLRSPSGNVGIYDEDLVIATSGTSRDDPTTLQTDPTDAAQNRFATLRGQLDVSGSYITVATLFLDGRSATVRSSSPRITGNYVSFVDDNVTHDSAYDCFRVYKPAAQAQAPSNPLLLRTRVHGCRRGVNFEEVYAGGLQLSLVYDNASSGIRYGPSARTTTVNRSILDSNLDNSYWQGSQTQSNVIIFSITSFPNRWNITHDKSDPITSFNAAYYNCMWSVSSYGAYGGDGIDPDTRSLGLGGGMWLPAHTGGDPNYVGRQSQSFQILPPTQTRPSPCWDYTQSNRDNQLATHQDIYSEGFTGVGRPPALNDFKQATHEGGTTAEYDPAAGGGPGGYYISQGTHAYQGMYNGYAQNVGTGQVAHRGFTVDARNGNERYYGGAFYFRPGTFANQQARIDIMRWDNKDTYGTGADYGGIALYADHRARLMRGKVTGDPAVQIGDSLPLREGCWNWIVVHQKLSDKLANDSKHAINEVFVNGDRLIDSDQPNSYGRPATAVHYGMPYVDAAQQTTIYVDVDDAFVADRPVVPRGNLCDPPRSRFSATPEESVVPDGGTSSVPEVRAVESAGDNVYIGGNFSNVGKRTGAFASLSDDSSASPDPDFPEVTGSDSASPAVVYAVASDKRGGWYIGGNFGYVGGAPRSNLAHIQANGGVDPSWAPSANGAVYALFYDGYSVYAGGAFTALNGQTGTQYLAGLNPETGANTGWAPKPNNTVRTIEDYGTGFFIGGYFTQVGGNTATRYVAKVESVGVLNWQANADGPVFAIAKVGGTYNAPNSVLVGGDFSHIGGAARSHIAEVDAHDAGLSNYNPLATTWNPGADNTVEEIAVSGSRFFVGGQFSNIASQSRHLLAAFDLSSRQLESTSSWPVSLSGTSVRSLAVSAGKLYVGGDLSTHDWRGDLDGLNLVAFDTATGYATQFDPRVGKIVEAVGVDGGRVAAGGRFRAVNVEERPNVAKLTADGKLTAWNPDPDYLNGTVRAMVVADGGTGITVGGSFGLRSYSTKDDAYYPTATYSGTSDVYALGLQGSVLYVGAAMVDPGSLPAAPNFGAIGNGANGSAATAPSVNGLVKEIAAGPDRVYIAGSFTTVGGQPRAGLASVYQTSRPTRGAVTAWDPRPDGAVEAMAIFGKRLYVGGSFTNFTTIPNGARGGLAEFSDGSLTSFNPGPNGPVETVAADGTSVFFGGRFSSVRGVTRNGFAAVDAETGEPSPFRPELAWQGITGSERVRDIDASPARVYVGGDFHAVGRRSQGGIARFDCPGYMFAPDGLDRTRRRLTIRAVAQERDYDKVSLEVRRTPADAWAAVPTGSSGVLANDRNERLGAGAIGLNDGLSPLMVWDVPSTPAVAGIDGDVQVRAVFSGPGVASFRSDPIHFTLDQKAAGTSDAVEPIGPGTVDLLTGNFGVERDDVSIDSGLSDLTFSRAFNSRDPDATKFVDSTGATSYGPLGPGWTSSLPNDTVSVDYQTLREDTITQSEIVPTEYDDGEIVDEEVTWTEQRATVTATDGTKFVFTEYEGTWHPEPGSEDLTLVKLGSTFELTDLEKTTTIFTQPSGTTDYTPSDIIQAGGATTSYGYEAVPGGTRIKWVVAPHSSGSQCSPYNGTSEPDCRFLTFDYAGTSTAIPGPGTLGDYPGRLRAIKLTAYESSSEPRKENEVARYSYDSNGRLREAWDPPNSAAAQGNLRL